MTEERQAVFNTKLHEVATLAKAQELILTPEDGTSTEERWEKEKAFLCDHIGENICINPESVVLDYGCGVGRLSKALIDKYDCRVVGVDSSQSMRLLATDYVLSDRFTVWSPETFEKVCKKKFPRRCRAFRMGLATRI
jgi:2-polyprenyl-3-methyl-5-hydroxy-6-metoxy-1,4-benzoquinol methylase